MTVPSRSRPNRRLTAVLATALLLAASAAEARPGRGGFGGGVGSRGARTYQAPPSTATAPRAAAPIERSAVPQQPGRPGVGQAGVQRPMAQQGGGFFGRSGGLMGGLMGAGLIGMLLGYGLFGGMGGLGSILGLLLQVALVAFLARLAWRAFQRRSQPAMAGAGAPLNRDAPPTPRQGGGGLGGLGGLAGGLGAARAGSPAKRDEVGVGQQDLNEFERLLGDVQAAYGREDAAALRASATPEMVGHLEEELADNARRGVANHVRDVRLLQGDLAESWREGGAEYATVAMRFALVDHTVDRATGRTVEGDPERPTEATEVWTFTRPRGGRWLLSAIQPA